MSVYFLTRALTSAVEQSLSHTDVAVIGIFRLCIISSHKSVILVLSYGVNERRELVGTIWDGSILSLGVPRSLGSGVDSRVGSVVSWG